MLGLVNAKKIILCHELIRPEIHHLSALTLLDTPSICSAVLSDCVCLTAWLTSSLLMKHVSDRNAALILPWLQRNYTHTHTQMSRQTSLSEFREVCAKLIGKSRG